MPDYLVHGKVFALLAVNHHGDGIHRAVASRAAGSAATARGDGARSTTSYLPT